MNELIEKKKEEFDKKFNNGKAYLNLYEVDMQTMTSYGNVVKSFLESSLKECWEKAQEEERKRIVEGMNNKIVIETHTEDCEYQRKGCDCGYMERVIYNKALEEIKSLIIKG